MKKLLVSYVLPVIAVLLVLWGCKGQKGQNRLCNHVYALCTSAHCVPDPQDSDQAICFCEVEEGPSLATVACDQLTPTTDDHGIRTIYSTFSLEQLKKGKRAMKCPANTPWSWCLNKKCTIDPLNPKKAVCVCDVVRTGEWTTLGGHCHTSTCDTGYWSGATLPELENALLFITESLNIPLSPMKWCRDRSL